MPKNKNDEPIIQPAVTNENENTNGEPIIQPGTASAPTTTPVAAPTTVPVNNVPTTTATISPAQAATPVNNTLTNEDNLNILNQPKQQENMSVEQARAIVDADNAQRAQLEQNIVENGDRDFRGNLLAGPVVTAPRAYSVGEQSSNSGNALDQALRTLYYNDPGSVDLSMRTYSGVYGQSDSSSGDNQSGTGTGTGTGTGGTKVKAGAGAPVTTGNPNSYFNSGTTTPQILNQILTNSGGAGNMYDATRLAELLTYTPEQLQAAREAAVTGVKPGVYTGRGVTPVYPYAIAPRNNTTSPPPTSPEYMQAVDTIRQNPAIVPGYDEKVAGMVEALAKEKARKEAVYAYTSPQSEYYQWWNQYNSDAGKKK